MPPLHKIAVIIPAYNEEASIADVVAEVRRIDKDSGFEITPVVVNDCSKDRTGEIIEHCDCIALHLPVNLGIGGAVQTGFHYALENDFDFAVQLDGDGQHPAECIPLLARYAEDHQCNIVIGSRFITREGFQSSFWRRAGIKWFKRLNKWLTGITVHDSTSGFRLIDRKTLEVVCRYYPDEYPEPEAIILYSKYNLKIGEVPVTMRERQGGTSSINSIRAIYYMWKVTLAVIFTRIRSSL